MGKIGDLWVKLGLKNDDFKKGMKESKKESSSFVDSIKGIKVKAAAIWAAVGAGAVAMADKFAHTSQQFGDKWDIAMSRMKSAWGQFLSSLTSWDWDGFWDRVKGGSDAAAKSTAAHDAAFEVGNSIKLRKAQMQEELALLMVQMRNQKNSYEKRAEYARQYLEKVKPLYAEEEKLRTSIAVADMNEFLAAAGLKTDQSHRDALVKFFTDIVNNESYVNALIEDYNHSTGKSTKRTAANSAIIDKLWDKYGSDTSSFAVLAKYYQSVDDKDAKKVVDALEAMWASKAAFNEETRRVQSVMNTAEAQAGIDTTGINTSNIGKSNEADAEKAQAAKIRQRAEDAAKEEIVLLQEKYETEKALLEKYGEDTTALTQEYLNNLLNLDSDWIEEIEKQCEDIEPVEIEPVVIDDSNLDAFIENLRYQMQLAQDISNAFNNAVVGGFSDGCQELMNQLMGVTDANPGAVLQAVLTPLADMAIRTGEIIMAEGLAVEAAKTSLLTMGGIGAIAAGAALIAAGTAVKAGLSAIANSSSTGTSTSSYSSASSSAAQTQNIESELTVYVEGRISGADILISGQRTQSSLNR